MLKTVREPLILLWGAWGLRGDELKIYATSAQALLLLGLVPLYGRLAGRVPRLGLVRRRRAVGIKHFEIEDFIQRA